MPRKPRFYLPWAPAHIIQRGISRQAVFFEDIDYRNYLSWLSEGAAKYGCAIHAYVLMTNHVHILMTPETNKSISQTIQYVGRHMLLMLTLPITRVVPCGKDVIRSKLKQFKVSEKGADPVLSQLIIISVYLTILFQWLHDVALCLDMKFQNRNCVIPAKAGIQ